MSADFLICATAEAHGRSAVSRGFAMQPASADAGRASFRQTAMRERHKHSQA
jgi:hypothetical protein